MSGKVSGWVWDQPLPQHLKYVLLAYADKADHEGQDVYPSVGLICRMTGLDRRTVQRSTRELEQQGFLVPEDQQAGGRGLVNSWRIPISGGEKGGAGAALFSSRRAEKGGAGEQKGRRGRAERAARVPPDPSLTVKEPSITRPADRPRAVDLFRRVMHRYPKKSQWRTIDRIVGSEFGALLRWGRVVRTWRDKPFDPRNVGDMLDVFRNGWRPRDGPRSGPLDVMQSWLQESERRADGQ